jgi:hypothetical protein
MRTSALILLTLLLVCLPASGAAPSITRDLGSADVTVTPGHSVAWIKWQQSSAYLSGVATDSDGDGRIRIQQPQTAGGSYLVVDLTTGEWAAITASGAAAPNAEMPLRTIQAGPDGAFTQLAIPASVRLGGMLWVRPGAGVWNPPSVRMLYEAGSSEFSFGDATTMVPLGDSGAVPAGFAAGDRLLILSGASTMVGLADPHLAAPPSPGVISMATPSFTWVEGYEAGFTIVRQGGTAGTASVRCCTFGGTAISGSDYAPFATQDVIFAPGELWKRLAVQLIDNDVYDYGVDRRIDLTLLEATGAPLGSRITHSINITSDNDPLPVSAFDPPASVVEGDASWTVNIPVTITGAFRAPQTVRFHSSTSFSAALTFQPGETVKTLAFPIAADDLPTPTRNIRLTMSGVTFVERTIIVVDDDPPTIRVVAPTTYEGWDRPIELQWFFEPSGGGDPVTLTWTGVDGTAKAGEDFLPFSNTVTSSDSSGSFWLPIRNDDIAEQPETFYVDLTVSGPAIPPAQTRYAITIYDDDVAAPPVTIDAPDVVSEASQTVPVTIRLAAAPQSVVSLVVQTTTGGTAAIHNDYIPFWIPLVFLPGEISKQVNLGVKEDIADENDETVELMVTTTAGGQLASRSITIRDNDTAIYLSVEDAVVQEKTGTSVDAVFRVKIEPRVVGSGSFKYATLDDSAIAGTDYRAASGTIELVAGQTEVEIRVEVFGDSLQEPDERFRLRLSNVTGAGLYLHRDIATAIVFDDDEPVVRPHLTITDAVTTETDLWSEAEFILRLSEAARGVVSVSYRTVEGSARAATDYEHTTGVVSFPIGQTEARVRVRIAGDRDIEGRESFSLVLSEPDGLIIDDATATCTIDNDDQPAPPISIEGSPVEEGHSGERTARFTLRLATASLVPWTFTVATTDAGTARPASDYRAFSQSVSFPAGQTVAFIDVITLGDTVVEGDETFEVVVSENGVVRARATVTILDDDAMTQISVASTTVVEGTGGSSEAIFQLLFSPVPSAGGTVAYTTVAATATAGVDYAHKAGTLAFAAGQTTARIPVVVFGDAITETDETFQLRLSSPTNGAALQGGTAHATILDDDASVVRPTVSIRDAATTETDGWSELTFLLQLSEATSVTTHVAYRTADAAAIGGFDFEHNAGVITFAAGTTTANLTVRIAGDRVHEPEETFTVILSDGEGVAIVDDLAVGLIRDDDSLSTKRRTVRH